jgi:hypothetical protein
MTYVSAAIFVGGTRMDGQMGVNVDMWDPFRPDALRPGGIVGSGRRRVVRAGTYCRILSGRAPGDGLLAQPVPF